jgi:cytochrome c biogenesis protein CcdA
MRPCYGPELVLVLVVESLQGNIGDVAKLTSYCAIPHLPVYFGTCSLFPVPLPEALLS